MIDSPNSKARLWGRLKFAANHDRVIQLVANTTSLLNSLNCRMHWRSAGEDVSQAANLVPMRWTRLHRQHAKSLHSALSSLGPHDLRLWLESAERMSAQERFSKEKT